MTMQNSLHCHCFREYLELIRLNARVNENHLTKCFKLNTDATKHQNMTGSLYVSS